MKLLGLDYESQGFPPEKTNATEVGCVLVELLPQGFSGPERQPAFSRTVLARFGTLIYEDSYPPQPAEIVELTGITDAELRDKGISPKAAVQEVLKLMAAADVVMTHNVQFDRAMFEEQCRRVGIEIPQAKWFCSLRDVAYPRKFKCKKLSHLALDHGVKLDLRKLHRAIDDVELMLDLVLDNYNIQELLDYQSLPKVNIKIDIPKPWDDGGKGRDHASAIGYAWSGKAWQKEILEKNFEVERENGKPYRVSMLLS